MEIVDEAKEIVKEVTGGEPPELSHDHGDGGHGPNWSAFAIGFVLATAGLYIFVRGWERMQEAWPE